MTTPQTSNATAEEKPVTRESAEQHFLKLSVNDNDKAAFSAATRAMDSRRSLEQKDRDYAMDREKFELQTSEKFLQFARDPKMRETIEGPGLSKAEVIARIRKAFFADIDAIVLELPE